VLLTAGTQLILWREPLRRCQAPPHSSGGIVKGRALLLLLLASCGVDEDFSQPLTALQVRSRIVGHSIRATDSSGASYGIYFRRTDFAEIYGTNRNVARRSISSTSRISAGVIRC
jgi:hypothetical protein